MDFDDSQSVDEPQPRVRRATLGNRPLVRFAFDCLDLNVLPCYARRETRGVSVSVLFLAYHALDVATLLLW